MAWYKSHQTHLVVELNAQRNPVSIMKFLVALVLAFVALVVITSAQETSKEKRGLAGLAYPGYAGLGYSGLGYAGLGYHGLGYSALGYPGYGYGYGLAAPHYIV